MSMYRPVFISILPVQLYALPGKTGRRKMADEVKQVGERAFREMLLRAGDLHWTAGIRHRRGRHTSGQMA
jgi:hypothetical protein